MTLLIRRITCALMLFLPGSYSFSQDTLRIMSYNILNYSGSSGVVTRYNDMKTIIDYVLPDIMICNELLDVNGAALLLNNAFNTSGRTNYARANFVDGPDTDNMLFYNTDKLTLQSQTQISTVLRDVSHYRLYYSDGPDTAWINILSAHLKAGNSASEASQRLTEVSAVCSAIAGASPNEAFIFGGDFNFYSSSEQAYNYLLSNSCTVRFYDPINQPGNWNANSSFANIHTQSTRTTASPGCCGGSIGGLDDRFDFLLANATLLNGDDYMQIIPGTYKSFGNDGNHYDVALTEGAANSVVPAAVNTALFNMSDHLPVMMDVLVQWDLSTGEPGEKYSFRIRFSGDDGNGQPLLYLNAFSAGNYSFEIIDAYGRKIESSTQNFTSGNHQLMPVTILAPGIYFLRVSFGDEIRTLKFVK